MSVAELAEGVRRAIARVADAHRLVGHAGTLAAETRDLFAALLSGTKDGEAEQLLARTEQACADLDKVHLPLSAIEALLTGYLDRLGASSPQATPTAPPRPAPVVASDGSRYPPDAAWCADILPRRVRTGQNLDRTIGYADGSFDQYTSREDGTWTPFIRDRLVELGFRPSTARFLSSHVEMKVASKMILDSKQHSELVINNVPCQGRTPLSPGCHEALSQYLPKGYTLTVRGTTQRGQPFSHTYRGQA